MEFTAYFSTQRALYFIAGSLAALVYLWVFSTSETKLLQSTLPVLFLAYSLSLFNKKHLVFRSGKLLVYANFGPRFKEHAYFDLSNFSIERNQLFLSKGENKLLITQAHMVRQEDWRTLEKMMAKFGKAERIVV